MVFSFSKACLKGFKGFIKFVEELLQGAKNGAKAENLAKEAKDIEEVQWVWVKKVEIIIHGDEDIKGGKQLFELLKD